MAILFDLDGTLTDPKPGIVRSIQYALRRLGAVVPSEDELEWCIGPPLWGSFAILLGTQDQPALDDAVALYRERFSDIGLYENAVYPGIVDGLEKLRKAGFPLFVATSKPHIYARRILDHFDLTSSFDGIYGSELDGTRSAKGDLIAHLLRSERLSPTTAIMVGDREHDVLGARQNGVPCVGVTYGYGSAEELDDAGAVVLCHSPSQVAEAVLSLQASLALGCRTEL